MAVEKILTPRPRTDPIKWAANREYPETSGHPGTRNPRKTPYVIAPIMAAHGRTHKRVIFAVSAQSGKTEAMFDLMGERLDTSPVPMIYTGPSKQFITEQLEPRIDELLRTTILSDRMAPDSRQKKTRKFVSGVPIRLAHGGSSTAMKSDPFGLAFTDEVDELMSNLKGQGNPVGLIDARGDTYPDFVHFIASTPSEGSTEVDKDPESGLEFWADTDPEQVKSAIWRLWLSGTRYHWAWPCPHCREYFIPRFECLAWDKPKDDAGRELKSTPSMAKNTAHLVCPNHGCLIYEDDPVRGSNYSTKEWMNECGDYVAPGQSFDPEGKVVGLPPESWTLSFWVSGLCSPFVPWGDRAAKYVEAVRSGNPGDVQSVKNQGFGELYAPGGGTSAEWTEVQKRASKDYVMGEVPEKVRVLTLTCDVQQDRLIYVVRGWGGHASSWLVDAGDIYGATEGLEVWNTLAELATSTFDGIPIKLGLVDSGFRPGKKFIVPEHRVYAFCYRFNGMVRPTKGSSTPMRKPISTSSIEIDLEGHDHKQSLELLRLDTDHFKSWVHQKVRWLDGMPGAWNLPWNITEDYCRQIASEARIRAPGGKVKWVVKSKNNHFLDCEAMQGACQMLLNLQHLRDDAPRPRRAVRELQPTSAPKPAPSAPRGGGGDWFNGESIW